MEQTDPLVDKESEECYRPQSTLKGSKHNLRTRWATHGVGSEVHMSSCMCTVYPQFRLGLEMGGAYTQLSLLPALTRKLARRWTLGSRTAQLFCPVFLTFRREDSLSAMVSHPLEGWLVSIMRR